MHALPHFLSYIRRNGLKHKLLFSTSLMIFFFVFADGIMTYMLPLIIVEHGFDKTQMGLIIGSSSLFGAGFDFWLSKYLKKPHYRRMYLAVLFAAAVFALILYQASSFWMFLLAMLVWGIYWDLFHFGDYDFVSRTVPEREHAGAFGVIGVFHALGSLLAPLVAGLLIGVGIVTDTIPLGLVMILLGVAGVFYIVSGSLRSLHEKKDSEIEHHSHGWWEEIGYWTRVGRQLWPLLILLFLIFTMESLFWTIGPLIAEQPEFGVFGGLFLTAFSLPMLVVGWFVGKLTHKKGKKRVAIVSFLIGSLIVSALPLVSQPIFMVGLVALASTFIAFSLPAVNGAFADYISETKAYEKEIQSLGDFFYNIGWAVGPIISGLLADIAGNKSAFAIVGLTSAVTCAFLLRVTPKKIKISVGFILIFLLSAGVFSHAKVFAFTITSDPQYVVINFADDFYFADWGAPEEEWQNEVEPPLKKTLEEMRERLGAGTEGRRLAWSTLLEYTDFPMDTPSSESRYAIQVRRIMELAEETDIPVFMPLNGFQWWNEVPELWNHWDYDGDQTLGCRNDEYTKIVQYSGNEPIYSCKFPKLRDPKFRERFINGYDPENKWNVEWQDWETPMRLNWRNWGAGGFQLAPPPNLAEHSRSALSYREFQQERFEIITEEIAKKLEEWEQQGKQDLFAGLAIGTEVSLNASVTRQDEFIPYGYRGIQDKQCAADEPTCGLAFDQGSGWEKSDLETLRGEVVGDYLADLSLLATKKGIPKQRVYTHVWSEAREGEPRYANYFAASHNLYARPTLSLYGDAQDPMSLPLLRTSLREKGQPRWGAAEFSTDKTEVAWNRSLANTLDNEINPAIMIDIYNWKEHKDTPAEGMIRRALRREPSASKPLTEIVPADEPVLHNPITLNWELLNASDSATKQELLVFARRRPQWSEEDADKTIEVDPQEKSWEVAGLSPNVYYWYVRRTVIDESGAPIFRFSEPRAFTIPVKVAEPKGFWQAISDRLRGVEK